jgi:hypothetical protein
MLLYVNVDDIECVTKSKFCVMPRGGCRVNAGSKPKWVRGKTTVIRVPEVLADEILRLAHLLDEGKPVDDVTQSKYLNLSGISIHSVGEKPAVFLEDLLKAGFKIRPIGLVDRLRKQLDRLK